MQEVNLAMKSELVKIRAANVVFMTEKYAMYFHYKCQSEETSPVDSPVKFIKREFGWHHEKNVSKTVHYVCLPCKEFTADTFLCALDTFLSDDEISLFGDM